MHRAIMYCIKQLEKYTPVLFIPPCNSVPTAIPRGLGYHHHGSLRIVICQLKLTQFLFVVSIGVEYCTVSTVGSRHVTRYRLSSLGYMFIFGGLHVTYREIGSFFVQFFFKLNIACYIFPTAIKLLGW